MTLLVNSRKEFTICNWLKGTLTATTGPSTHHPVLKTSDRCTFKLNEAKRVNVLVVYNDVSFQIKNWQGLSLENKEHNWIFKNKVTKATEQNCSCECVITKNDVNAYSYNFELSQVWIIQLVKIRSGSNKTPSQVIQGIYHLH